MNTMVIISFLLLGIAAFVIQKKRRFQQIDALHLLFFAALAIAMKVDFEDASRVNQWTYTLIAVVALNFLLSRWSKLRNPFIRLVPPLVSFAVLFGVYWNDSFLYLGNNFNMSDKATVVLPFLGILIYEIAWLKVHFLKKFFGLHDSFVNVLMPLFIGLTALIGAFNAGGYGVFLVGSGFLTASFYNASGSKHIIHSIFAVAVIWLFASQSDIELIDLRFGKVVAGLFVGAFVGGFVLHMWSVEKRKNLALLLTYFLVVLIVTGLLMAGTQINVSFGGVEAYLGALMGFAIANSLLFVKEDGQELQQAPIMMSGLVPLLLIGFIVPPLLVNEEEKAIEETLKAMAPQTNEKGEEIVVPFIPIADLVGSHKIDPATSIISFKLGAEGSVTKGAIKEFTGTINISQDLKTSTFDIKLPVLNLTTFLSMRDESIMGEEYFKADKFPSMTFKSSEMTPTDKENEYELIGTFEMLGVKKDQKVRVHRIEEGSKKVLVGSGEIDRRKFGMSDDPREGNIVSFEFKVELK